MLRLRKKTTGVLETKFETKGLFFQYVSPLSKEERTVG
jgi:hypothetical protein